MFLSNMDALEHTKLMEMQETVKLPSVLAIKYLYLRDMCDFVTLHFLIFAWKYLNNGSKLVELRGASFCHSTYKH